MDQETLAHMFEPFFTTKAQGKGTGLGLATVYGIVKQNDGFITVDSETGRGTTFRIYLPRHAALAAEEAEKQEHASSPTGTETVLLVEDEASLLRLAHRLLDALGYTVLAADGPDTALRLAAEYKGEIHLLLTDVVMPGMSGNDLRHRLAATRPKLKCLFMSGYTADVIAHRGVLSEGIQFIQKPFAKVALARKLREVLEEQGKA
jgi:CheY-like chemotaxis protein